ncbi:MAG: biopolymer transporter ExbD [Spirochaetales bacterium]
MVEPAYRLRRTSSEPPSLLLTPLIDVLLVLICFVLSVSFQIQGAIDVKLPDAQTGQLVTTDTLTVSITRDSTLVLQGRTVTLEGFSAVLRQILTTLGSARSSAVVQGDEEIPYALLIAVMDALRAQGVTDISLLTQTRGSR